ncbi:Kelch repeat-containing protein [Flagellimonas sp.]|uniref:Kelch repeat-containing protein n=1 Tax=Flagellimonas sp. TaxID=2058762 RepID=UPI003BB174A5
MKILKSYSFKKWLVFGLPTLAMCVIIACSDDDGKTDDGTGGTDDDPTPETMTFTSFDPMEGERGSTVELTGTSFSTTTTGNTVKFGTVDAEVTGATPTMLTVTVPDNATSGTISVSTGTTTVTSTGEFNVITGKWRQVADFGGGPRADFMVTASETKGYAGFGIGETIEIDKKDIWIFDPNLEENGTWSLMEDEFPGSERWIPNGITIDETLYILGGYGYVDQEADELQDFYSYTSENGWHQEVDLPGELRRNAVVFSANSKIYYGLGGYGDTFYTDLWAFDPDLEEWGKVSSFTGTPREDYTYFVIDGALYFGLGDKEGPGGMMDFWKYDSSSDVWTELSTFPGGSYGYHGAFSLNGKGYITTGYNGDEFVSTTWEYTPENDSWTKKSSFKGEATHIQGFSIGNRGYVIGGYLPENNISDELWEFNPEN